MRMWWRFKTYTWPTKLAVWAAHRLPRWLVYWASIRLGSHATTGVWGHEDPTRTPILTALERWRRR